MIDPIWDTRTTLGVAVAVCSLTAAALWFVKRSRNLPPGPTGLPVLGNLLRLLPDPAKQMGIWSHTYGKTICIWYGNRPMVVMHDYETAKTIFSHDNTTGRDGQDLMNHFAKGRGLLLAENDVWRVHRRFALSTLRDMGMGKSWLEDAILEEVDDLCEWFDQRQGTPVNPRHHLTQSVSNVICALVFGKRFQHDDEKFNRLSNMFAQNIRLMMAYIPVQLFPFLKFIPFGKFHRTLQHWTYNITSLLGFVKSLIDEHRVTGGPETNDYVSCYLSEQKAQSASSSSSFTDEQLYFSVLNLFGAGSETTSTTLLWGFIYMLENPDVMKKVQEELDEHIPRNQHVRLQDKMHLPFTEATLLEIQRLASAVPLGLVHRNLEATVIDGFTIPKGTLLAVNGFAIHRDPKYWPNPTQFRPERFLEDGGSLKGHNTKGFVPFGIGKRACLGEALAKMELYLFFANLLQKYDLQDGASSSSLKVNSNNCTTGLIRSPCQYEIHFTRRRNNKVVR